MWNSIADILVRTTTVYFFLLVGVRLSGKREVGQLMPFDFVLLLVLSNAVQNAMVGPNNSLWGGLVAAGTLLLLTRLLNLVGSHHPHMRRLLVGAPTVLVIHGLVQHRNLEREHICYDELMQTLREHEVSRPEEVELATLELDGNVSVIRRKDNDTTHYVKTRRHLRRNRYPA